jgi:hypothetical protein
MKKKPKKKKKKLNLPLKCQMFYDRNIYFFKKNKIKL